MSPEVEAHAMALNQMGTLLSNHAAQGSKFSFVTDRDPQVEMSHCNLPSCYVIAQQ